MTWGFSAAVRNARLDAITTATGSAGFLRVYDGTRPATGGTATTKLIEFTMGTPFASAASSGVLTFNLPANTTGITAGTATWARLVKADGTTIIGDFSVGTSGADFNLNTTTISSGVTCSITSATLTDGNP